MIPRYTPLRRGKPPKKKRAGKPRPGRLQGTALDMLRADCYLRSTDCDECGEYTVFNAPHTWPNSFHMAHIKAKRIGLDTLSNVRTLCGDCHRKEHNYGKSMDKPCPPKPK